MRWILGVVTLAIAAAAYFLWPNSAAPATKQATHTAGPPASSERLRRDAQGLARAFSLVAARTMGTVVISGEVRDQHTGEPVANAEVIFSGPSGESSTLCDGSGRYRAELLPGFYRGYAQASGYVAVARAAAERLPGAVSAAAVAMPREGIAPLVGVFRDESGVQLRLTPAARIEGRVMDGEGFAISGAVVAGRASGNLRVISGSDVSESDGSGFYELLVPAGDVSLEANHERYATLLGTPSAYTRPREVLNRDLILARGCIIEGGVVDASGVAVASGSFERKREDASYAPIGEIQNGAVRFATQTVGEVTLRAWPWKSPPSKDQVYICEDGVHYSGESFVIPDASPALTGTVTDSDGEPVGFAFVDLFGTGAGGATQQERADAQGAFSFYALPDGPYQLSSYVPGKGTSLTLVDVPSTGVPLRLSGVGTLVGSIAGMDHGSITVHYRCVFDQGGEENTLSDEVSMPVQTLLVPVSSSRFRIDDLPACPLRGAMSADSFSQMFRTTIKRTEDAVLRINTSSP
ncbi:MAG: carboxypeptidase regulatory-like domain-containing protein [Myxococcales bacterium]|nr:carboxypeptidase regulatory-like domain-containing protein [Myxococcales bacterium]